MGRIKISLVSGAVVEKALLNAFKVADNSYVVLDNEMNGSMGLPIILVSKIDNNRLVKITDQNEWTAVKEHLKNIIAGNAMEFINIPAEMSGDDVYYTQLTLPLPSFDALKNAYVVNESTQNAEANPEVAPQVAETPEVAPVETPQVETVTPEVTPTVEVTPSVEAVSPEVTPVVPDAPQVAETPEVSLESAIGDIGNIGEVTSTETPVDAPNVDINIPTPEVTPVETPTVEPAPSVEPVIPDVSIPEPTPAVTPQVEPEITPTPTIEPSVDINNVVTEDSYKEEKEAFLKACENMFDALVQKFEKKN